MYEKSFLKKVQQNAEKIGCALFSYLDIQYSGLTYYVMTKCYLRNRVIFNKHC